MAVSDGGVEIARYGHNAAGQRVVKQVGLERTHYLYDSGGRLIAEVDARTGAVPVEYVWLGGAPLAAVFGGGLATYYVHADHLGTPQVLTDAGGRIVWSAIYRPFGETASAGGRLTGGAAFNLRFPGQYFDAETGLHYNGYRDYDPGTGRYVQSDPIGLQGGFNVYAYVGGSPLTQVDPYGLEILLQTHPVAFGWDHSKLTIIPDNQTRWLFDPRFNNMLADGRLYSTIGGGPEDGFLVSDFNRERDINLDHNVFSVQCENEDLTLSENELIELLLQADANYADNLDYEFFPQSYTDGFNSNSYISGLLEVTGFLMDAPPDTPGFEKPVPADEFR